MRCIWNDLWLWQFPVDLVFSVSMKDINDDLEIVKFIDFFQFSSKDFLFLISNLIASITRGISHTYEILYLKIWSHMVRCFKNGFSKDKVFTLFHWKYPLYKDSFLLLKQVNPPSSFLAIPNHLITSSAYWLEQASVVDP